MTVRTGMSAKDLGGLTQEPSLNPRFGGKLPLHPQLLNLCLSLVPASKCNPKVNILGPWMPDLVLLPQAGATMRKSLKMSKM